MYPAAEAECRRVKTRLPSKRRAGRGAEAPHYHNRRRLQQLGNRFSPPTSPKFTQKSKSWLF